MTKRVAILAAAVLAAASADAGTWPKRMGNAQNTGNVGADAITALNARDLAVTAVIPTDGTVNATPIVAGDLLFIGDGGAGRYFYVIDLANGFRRLVKLDTGATVSTPLIGSGVQSTALYAEVTVPGQTLAERRVYFGANVKPKSFWCLSVERILADRPALLAAAAPSDGAAYLCGGADWPIMIAGVGDVETNDTVAPLPVYNGAPTFSKAQRICNGAPAPDPVTPLVARTELGNVVGQPPGGEGCQVRDVVYTPTIGADCSDGQLWAIDAVTAEVYWIYDPVPNFQNLGTLLPVGVGSGGMIWTVPAIHRDRKYLYVTTGDCVEQPQLGFQAESLVALNPETGVVEWYQQRRLTDVSDYDVGNSPVVVDVDGADGCHVVVTSDKDGCIYAHSQDPDIPQVGAIDFDPTRLGQQRTLWRTCFVPGSLGGGFNASAVTVNGRTVFAQAAEVGSRVPGDTVNAFAVDACDGTARWWTGAIEAGSGEGAIASDLYFQPSGRKLQVMRAAPTKELIASVTLPDGATPGGGGPAIVDGTIYVPIRSGVAVVRVETGSNASPPDPMPADTFGGPYPLPIGTGVEQPRMPIDPYDPNSPPAPAVSEWPSMHR